MQLKRRSLWIVAAILGAAPFAAAQEMRPVQHADWATPSAGPAATNLLYETAAPGYGPVSPVVFNQFQALPEYPPDPNGPSRMETPNYINQPQFETGHPIALNTRPDAPTMGIRLDDTYGVLRNVQSAHSFSEFMILNGGGGTILPYQSPCTVIGLRGMGYYLQDHGIQTTEDSGFSFDLFGGTRYKMLYLKGGPLWDYHQHFGKLGFTTGAMTRVPLIGYTAFESAFAWGTGDDILGPLRSTQNLRLERVEDAIFDWQMHLGRFWRPNFEAGFSSTYRTYDYVEDQWGIGTYGNLDLGRLRFTGDITGGNENIRAYLTVAFSFGVCPKGHPRDPRVINVDTVAWVTRAVERDFSIFRQRSFTGPLPPNP